MASKFIKGLFEKLTILPGDWLIMQPDAEEDTAYKIKKSNVKSDATEPNTWYVNTNGNDSNAGSDKFPFETIQAAHDVAVENDTIVIQDIFFSQSAGGTTTITKDITIKGVVTNISTLTRLKGTWTVSANVALRLEMLSLFFVTLDGPGSIFLYLTNCATSDLKTGSSRFVSLNSQSSIIDLAAPSNYLSVLSYNSDIVGDLSVGSFVKLFGGSLITGNVTAGIDGAQTLIISNSTIDGNVINTGNLIKKNGIITGTETITGTPTDRQAKVFDDSVEFKDKVSIGVATFLNSLDVAGGMVVGSSYAAISTAPTDGALFEGDVAIGRTTAIGAILHTKGIVKLLNADDKGLTLGANGSVSILTASGTTGLTLRDTNNGIFDFRGGDQTWRQVSLGAGNFEIRDENQGGAARIVLKGTSGFVGLGEAVPAAQADINQSSLTAAVPVLKLTQADLSEEMIKFDATIGVGNTIEAIGAKSFTQTHFLKINVEGLGVKYMPIGDLA